MRIRKQAQVEIELSSDRPFPVLNAIPVLQIGEQSFTSSRYPPSGDTHVLIFTLTAEEFARARPSDRVTLKYDPDAPERRWSFGELKNFLTPPTQ